MTRTEFDVRSAEPTLDEDQLAGIVPFDRMTDELQDIADHKCDQRPPGRVAPHQKVNWQDERYRQSDQMNGQIAGMEMAFTIIFEEAAHQLGHGGKQKAQSQRIVLP